MNLLEPAEGHGSSPDHAQKAESVLAPQQKTQGWHDCDRGFPYRAGPTVHNGALAIHLLSNGAM